MQIVYSLQVREGYMSIDQQPEPQYGASAHYRGAQGEAYFQRQSAAGRLGARWNLALWMPWVQPEDALLDFGCGGGYLLALLPARRKLGVEINPAARAVARGLGLEVVPTLDQVEARSITCVISSHALEHVPAPLTALRQMNEKLIPGGRLGLLLPLDDWRASAQRNYIPDNLHRHLYAWTPQSLGNLLAEAGYRDIRVRIVTDAMPPNLRLAEWLLGYPLLRRWVGEVLSLALRRRQLFAVASL